MQPKRIPVFDFVETLERNRLSLFWDSLHTVLPLPPLRHPPHYDNHQKADGKIRSKKVKEDIPVGCLPLQGREAVSLLVPVRE